MKASIPKIGVQQVIAIAVFAGWLMQAIWVSPVSPQAIQVFGQVTQNYADENKQTIEELNRKGLSDVDVRDFGVRVKSELQRVWIFWLTLIVMGFGAAVMAFFNIKFWRIAILVTSLVYLWVWYNTGTTAYVGVVQAYKAKIMLAENQGTMGWFFVRDIFLPILFTSTVVYAMANYVRRASN